MEKGSFLNQAKEDFFPPAPGPGIDTLNRVQDVVNRLATGQIALDEATRTFGDALRSTPWPEIMTPDEASRFLRVSPATLRKAVKRGDFPVLHVAGRWRVSRSVLEKYLSGETKVESGLSNRSRKNIIRRGGSHV